MEFKHQTSYQKIVRIHNVQGSARLKVGPMFEKNAVGG